MHVNYAVEVQANISNLVANRIEATDIKVHSISATMITAKSIDANSISVDFNKLIDKSSSSSVVDISIALSGEVDRLSSKLSVDGVLTKNGFNFGYNKNTNTIELSVVDINGNVHGATIHTADFADDFVVSCAKIENLSGSNYLVIYWNTEEKTEIPLSAISQTYKGGNGIDVANVPSEDSDGGLSYKISVTDNLSIDGSFNSNSISSNNATFAAAKISNLTTDFQALVDVTSNSSLVDISTSLTTTISATAAAISTATDSLVSSTSVELSTKLTSEINTVSSSLSSSLTSEIS